MSWGRTKAEAVVTDVLAPKAVEEVINKLSVEKPLPFSIQTDASNKGNRKMFLLAVQFFTPESRVINKLIDFVENPNESAEGIVNTILSSLENLGLTLDHMSAFSADNVNVNYGIHDSVVTKLKTKSNSDLLQGNCHAHIVHNTIKHALDQLSVDVENIVIKVYSFFSISAKRRESLKEFCAFCDVEFHEILRHMVTRWLSLNPAIKKLERDDTTSADLCAIMHSFLRRLTQRRDDGFCGFLTKQKLRRLSPSDADVARQEFTAFLNTAISYVQKWFNFSEDNWLFHLQPLSLTSGGISYDDMEKITEWLHLVVRLNISMDELYDECVIANSTLERLTEHQEWVSRGTTEKWMAVLQAADLPNILAVVSFVLSIPSSTGYVERVFSSMKNKWTDVRNKCSDEE